MGRAWGCGMGRAWGCGMGLAGAAAWGWPGLRHGVGLGLSWRPEADWKWGVWGGEAPPRKMEGGGTKNDEKIKVSRMKFSIVEILSGLQENVFSLFRRPQLHFGEKSKKLLNFINLFIFTVFPYFPRGVPWAGSRGPGC